MCYKTVSSLCDLEVTLFPFAPISSVTRGHHKELIKPDCLTSGQLNLFSNRVVNYWNSLPPDFVNAKTIGSFSGKLILLGSVWVIEPSIGHCYILACKNFFIYLN